MHSSEGFSAYREMARDTVLAGRLQANMLMVRMNVKDFIITGSEKDKGEYRTYYEKTSGFIEEAKKEIQKPSRAEIIKHVSEEVLEYDKGFKEVTNLMTKRDTIVNGTLNIKGPAAEKKLSKILSTAARDKDMVAAYNAGVATRHLLLGRLYATKFLDDNSQSSVDRVRKEFDLLNENLTTLDKNLQNRTRRKLLKEVQELRTEYITAFEELAETIFIRNKIIKGTLDKIGPMVAKQIEDVKLDIKSVQDQIGPELTNANQNAEHIILLTSLIAAALGVIIALFFTNYITKTISTLSEDLKVVASNVLSAGNSVLSGSRSLLDSGQRQSESLTSTSAATTEISEMVARNSTASQETTEVAANCLKEAENGQKSVKSVQQSIDKIHQNSEDLTASIEESNKEIEGGVTIINEIVEKTQVINDIVFFNTRRQIFTILVNFIN